jgi:hypothetical protein
LPILCSILQKTGRLSGAKRGKNKTEAGCVLGRAQLGVKDKGVLLGLKR